MPARCWTIHLARWLGVAPWDLEQAPAVWEMLAEAMREGEQWAERDARAHAAAAARNAR